MRSKKERKRQILKYINDRIELLEECLKTWQGIRKRPKAMKMLKKNKKFYDNLIIDGKARIKELRLLKKELRK